MWSDWLIRVMTKSREYNGEVKLRLNAQVLSHRRYCDMLGIAGAHHWCCVPGTSCNLDHMVRPSLFTNTFYDDTPQDMSPVNYEQESGILLKRIAALKN